MTAIGSAGAGFPSCKFVQPGDTHEGRIVAARDEQETDFTTRQPKTYPDGNPIMQTVVTLEVGGPGELANLYVKGPRMFRAVKAAVIGAGANDVEVGGHLKVTFTGTEAGKMGNVAKCYTAVYKPPVSRHTVADTFAPVEDEGIPASAFADDKPPF